METVIEFLASEAGKELLIVILTFVASALGYRGARTATALRAVIHGIEDVGANHEVKRGVRHMSRVLRVEKGLERIVARETGGPAQRK